MLGDRDRDTICAVSTPPGHGGISVIRLSGESALRLVRAMAPFVPEKPESHRIYYGHLVHPSRGERIDEVLISWFDRQRSFTGEFVAEISCHGSPLICSEILESLIDGGARHATRGEFTYRAFMNGRLDLVQAESVLDLIESQSKASKKIALDQLRGKLSERISHIEDDLTWCLAHIEAGIDFSTEGLEIVDPQILRERLRSCRTEIDRLTGTFDSGRLLKEGFRVALVGRPNVGKSSLMNNLLERDRSIVTDIAGTTRDVVDGELAFDGVRFILMDTAGIRETEETVEKIGIERSRQAIARADAVVLIVAAGELNHPDDQELLGRLDLERSLIVVNKCDLLIGTTVPLVLRSLEAGKTFTGSRALDPSKVICVSALDPDARMAILGALVQAFLGNQNVEGETLVSSRHYELLTRASSRLKDSLMGLENEAGPEFVALDLKESLLCIQEILGKYFDDQIMDRVFKEFCLGK